MPACKCSKPPGGGGQCPSNHIAVCRVDMGQCNVSCIPLNRDLVRSKSGFPDESFSERLLGLLPELTPIDHLRVPDPDQKPVRINWIRSQRGTAIGGKLINSAGTEVGMVRLPRITKIR